MSRSNETKPDTTGGLRRRAEIVLQGRVLDMDELSTENVQQMIHELQVHKIELEIQNEELRQTQLKLAETRDHFVDLYNFAPVGYCTINDKGVIVQANLTLALMLGVDRSYLLKKPIASFVAFADQDKLFLFQRQVLRAKTRQLCELQFVKKDGALLDAELESIAVANDFSRIVISDISERKQAKDALYAQAQQMQQIMDSVPDGVLVLNNQCHVVMANPTAIDNLMVLSGTAPGEKLVTLGGYPVARLLEPSPKGIWHEIEHDGRIFEATTRPLSGEPKTDGWVLVISDVTQQRKSQTTIKRQERLASIGHLAAGIAHDFNNILAVISLYSEVTLNESFMSPITRQRLEIINDQVRKAADLIQQMLDFSRSTMLQPKTLDFISFLTQQIELFKRTLPEHIAIDFTYDSGNYMLKADPARLQQVVMNLAINARDAMPTGGALHFSLKEFYVDGNTPPSGIELPVGLWISLAVHDSGTGISADAIGHIFEPFYTSKELGQGTGLGLAQVYGIVKQHGGEVVVESQPGQGTTFTVFLPAPVELTGEPVRPKPLEPLLGNQETILVVEDEDILREVLEESLQSLNYQVITAVDGEEALAIYKEQSAEIALILSDMVMPGISGETLFYELKKQNPTLKMIILTGYAQKDKLQELRLQGLDNWLFKPPSLEDLAKLVAQSLQ